jgi:norsolorinic acid ketoreductase
LNQYATTSSKQTQLQSINMSQAWLVTGANRGIGFEIVKSVAARPNTTVFAGARVPSKATALQQLASENANLHIIKLDSASAADAEAAAQTVQKITGGLDVVIANAGIAQDWTVLLKVDTEQVYEHFKVNSVGPLILFQALYPLLLNRQTRKFVTTSSLVGSIGDMLEVPETAYGTSKAALNFITKRIHLEHSGEGFIAFPIHPGVVNTEMGQAAAPVFGLERFPVAPEDSAKGVLAVVDSATASESGRFWSYDGAELPW